MTWLLTYTGAAVGLDFVDPHAISILDIAAGLSKVNRFNGHTRRLYSVAEHSLHVCHVLERDLHVSDPKVLLAGLLHDAHEAYIGDLSTPMKQAIAQLCGSRENPWALIEQRAEEAVLGRFDVLDAAYDHRDLIKRADLIMLCTERQALLPPSGPDWPVLDEIYPALDVHLDQCAGLSPDDWRDIFVDRFADLRSGIALGRYPYATLESE